ncbi:hypothetical protein AAFF_G00006030 [Aldrovandia affinis]|uniref:Uncharacterized protein n=1 Tax=Aldrovandia affinis TaxID=143900 RepID=A0AAD7TDS2_9TELE|nr:hypothetical protein AAFF_G00006030 [Aldrovandia affinis]
MNSPNLCLTCILMHERVRSPTLCWIPSAHRAEGTETDSVTRTATPFVRNVARHQCGRAVAAPRLTVIQLKRSWISMIVTTPHMLKYFSGDSHE